MRRVVPLFVGLIFAACMEPTSTEPTSTGAFGTGGPSLSSSKNDEPHVFNTQLRPENEVPSSSSMAWGNAQIKISDDNTTVDFKIKVVNPANEAFFAGHIHRAPKGVAGPIVVHFNLTPSSDDHIEWRGTVPVDPATAQQIRETPENFYINLHTAQVPTGAIRGQLGIPQS
jgi:hypothetical protein